MSGHLSRDDDSSAASTSSRPTWSTDPLFHSQNTEEQSVRDDGKTSLYQVYQTYKDFLGQESLEVRTFIIVLDVLLMMI